jgi:L-threonylcarbamoyladenylate synthase
VPELRGRPAVLAGALLPGAFTLVLPNPGRRFGWLNGLARDTIGVRVPVLEGAAREVLEQVGAVAATSANRHRGLDPRRLEEVSAEIRRACAAEIDAGELPGVPSTVVDLTGPEPRILREGAVPAADTLARLSAVAA